MRKWSTLRYIEGIPIMFKKAKIICKSDSLANMAQAKIPFPVNPYTQEELKKAIEKQFGSTMTIDQ